MDFKLYYSAGTGGFYDSRINSKIPDDAVEISQQRYSELRQGEMNGKNIVPNEQGLPNLSAEMSDSSKTQSERSWRNSELSRSDIELNKVQDADPKANGTVSQWRDYRKALRAWPESKDFLNKDKRPVAPDA